MQQVGPPNRYAPHATREDWEEADAKQLERDKGDGTRGYYLEMLRGLGRLREVAETRLPHGHDALRDTL